MRRLIGRRALLILSLRLTLTSRLRLLPGSRLFATYPGLFTGALGFVVRLRLLPALRLLIFRLGLRVAALGFVVCSGLSGAGSAYFVCAGAGLRSADPLLAVGAAALGLADFAFELVGQLFELLARLAQGFGVVAKDFIRGALDAAL